MNERAEFEAWYDNAHEEPFRPCDVVPGNYWNPATQASWAAWSQRATHVSTGAESTEWVAKFDKVARRPKGVKPDTRVEARGMGCRRISRADLIDWRHVQHWRLV